VAAANDMHLSIQLLQANLKRASQAPVSGLFGSQLYFGSNQDFDCIVILHTPFRSAAPIAYSIGTWILKVIGTAERNGAGL